MLKARAWRVSFELSSLLAHRSSLELQPHFRWSYPESAKHLSRILVAENVAHDRAPQFVMRYLVVNRQRSIFVTGDGVTPATRDHVEKIYHDSLAHLSAILATRPYLLGARPSLADFGFFGPMLRHFAQDPTSGRIMRETAPLCSSGPPACGTRGPA